MADQKKVETHMQRGNLVDATKAWKTIGVNSADRFKTDKELPGSNVEKPVARKPYKPSERKS